MEKSVRLPGIKEWSSLVGREADVVRPYAESSLSLGRHLDRFVLTSLGETGHGKTKTINRLIDNNLLEVARRCAGSTTKVAQRANVPITFDSEGNLIELTVSFDDTPGFGGTIANDRERHQELLDSYAENYFPTLDESRQVYPSVILIITSWDSVKGDDNDPPSIDKTIQYLSRSRLVDNKRGNVIVVVTKSLSFWNDYEDVGSQKKRDACWRDDAEKKKSIINLLRSKAFEGTGSDWPVVFAENGGGASAKPRRLPNDESYPQNLFNAIKNLVYLPGPDQPQDLVGTAALQYLTGVLQPSGRPTTEILGEEQPEDAPNPAGTSDERLADPKAGSPVTPVALDNQKGLWRLLQLHDVRLYLAKALKTFRRSNTTSKAK